MGVKEIKEEHEAALEILRSLVMRLAVAAVDPEEFTDIDTYVNEVFAFAESGEGGDPPSQEEIDALAAVIGSEYVFDDDDEEGASEAEEPET